MHGGASSARVEKSLAEQGQHEVKYVRMYIHGGTAGGRNGSRMKEKDRSRRHSVVRSDRKINKHGNKPAAMSSVVN